MADDVECCGVVKLEPNLSREVAWPLGKKRLARKLIDQDGELVQQAGNVGLKMERR